MKKKNQVAFSYRDPGKSQLRGLWSFTEAPKPRTSNSCDASVQPQVSLRATISAFFCQQSLRSPELPGWACHLPISTHTATCSELRRRSRDSHTHSTLFWKDSLDMVSCKKFKGLMTRFPKHKPKHKPKPKQQQNLLLSPVMVTVLSTSVRSHYTKATSRRKHFISLFA